MVEERYELVAERIKEIGKEQTVAEKFRGYFQKMSEFAESIQELKCLIESGRYKELPLSELEEWNDRLYRDILPKNYEKSYANPAYAVEMLGEEYGRLFCFLYAELRGAVVYTFEGRTEYLAILFELLMQVYNQFEEEALPEAESIRKTIY